MSLILFDLDQPARPARVLPFKREGDDQEPPQTLTPLLDAHFRAQETKREVHERFEAVMRKRGLEAPESASADSDCLSAPQNAATGLQSTPRTPAIGFQTDVSGNPTQFQCPASFLRAIRDARDAHEARQAAQSVRSRR